MKKIFIFCLLVITNIIQAQKDSMEIKPVFGVTLRSGTLTYFGDLNEKKLPFTSNNDLNYGFSLSGKWKFATANLNYDIIKFGQELNKPGDHRNFRAKGSLLGVDVNFWPVLKRNYGIYIGTGLSYISYDLLTDTLDAAGNKYYYWADGSIRNEAETYQANFSAVKLKRDDTYESSLGSKSYLMYPLRAGIMLRFIKDVQMSYNFSYYFTNKNDVDGFSGIKKNNFMYNTVSLTWYFNSYDKVDSKKYYNVDFIALINEDEDGDGVKDKDDRCFGTPKDVKVNGSGCPYDGDGDGVDDYKDKEKSTGKKKLSDLEGVGHEPGVPEKDDGKEVPEEAGGEKQEE